MYSYIMWFSCEETQRKSRRKECYQSGYDETNKRSVLDSTQPKLSCRYEEKSRQVFGDVLSPAAPTLSSSLLCSTIVLYDKCALGMVLLMQVFILNGGF